MKILIANQQKSIKINRRKIRSSMIRLMKATNCSGREISISIVDDTTIQTLNREYLKRDKPTAFLFCRRGVGGVNDVLGASLMRRPPRR